MHGSLIQNRAHACLQTFEEDFHRNLDLAACSMKMVRAGTVDVTG
jgi:hypothetical protein